MNRFRWPLLLLGICLPLVYLAAGFRLPWLSDTTIAVQAVPAGDHEFAWFNTSTGGATWERFVTGVHRLTLLPGVTVDDTNAYPTHPTAVPEVVIAKAGVSAKIRIRWYKLTSDQSIGQWLAALAKRDPAPLAIIGGSSSDRARDFALALDAQKDWQGQRPLFAITNGTAIDVAAPPGSSLAIAPLMKLYEGRTFRFCFNNRQMAGAMLDFAWQHPDLKPVSLAKDQNVEPVIFSLTWKDDPYSDDMGDQIRESLESPRRKEALKPFPRTPRWKIPFSIGGFTTPNSGEAAAAESILKELRTLKQQRSLLVIPTVTAPARRVLMRLCEEDAGIGNRLVALNGDGMGVNAVLRDGEFNWPVASIPVPLVLFTHNNPAAWDNDALQVPNSTEDVLHYAETVRILSEACFVLHSNGVAVDANQLIRALQTQEPPYFHSDGNRLGNTGEYVFVLRPPVDAAESNVTAIEVWRRNPDRLWQRVERRTLPLKPPGAP